MENKYSGIFDDFKFKVGTKVKDVVTGEKYIVRSRALVETEFGYRRSYCLSSSIKDNTLYDALELDIEKIP